MHNTSILTSCEVELQRHSRIEGRGQIAPFDTAYSGSFAAFCALCT